MHFGMASDASTWHADRMGSHGAGALGTFLDPLAHALLTPARAQRVITLVAASMLMSLGDLYMTMTYVTSVGMIEANPLARQLMTSHSPIVVIAWKLALTAMATTALLCARRRRLTEVAAWVVFAAMTWLTIHWYGFNTDAAEMTDDYHVLATMNSDQFVQMAE